MTKSESKKMKHDTQAVMKKVPPPPPAPVKRAISVRALIQRLNRVLPNGQKVMRSKPLVKDGLKHYPNDVGRFWVLNESMGGAVETNLDLEAFGRRHAALKAWEVVLIDH